MKKLLFTLLGVLMITFSGYADKYSIDRNDLPETAQAFLKKHFPKTKVGMVKTDRHLLKKTDYDVKLVNGTKIEFNNSGKWTSVDCKNRQVPDGIIPKNILSYVKKNFPDVFISSIEKSTSKYTVGLSDQVELTFNLLGQFKSMKMDD